MRTIRRTIDAISPNAIRADMACRAVTIREVPDPTTTIQYWGGSGDATNSLRDTDSYLLGTGEAIYVARADGRFIPLGHILGWMQAGAGSPSIALLYED